VVLGDTAPSIPEIPGRSRVPTLNERHRRKRKSGSSAIGTGLGDADKPPTPVEAFAAELADELVLGRRSVDVRRRRVLYLITRWATSEGLPLDRELILDPATVERFCSVALANVNSRATLRADLRYMGPLLTRSAPWEPRSEPMSTRAVAPPYTSDEVEVLKADAKNQPTPTRRRGATTLLALGLGAGLDGRWIAGVGPDDVRKGGGVVKVRVGPPAPRVVVVRAEWEDAVLELATTAGKGCLLGKWSNSKNRVGDLSKRLSRPSGHPHLSIGRLRSTWLLEHLESGTRLPELCEAAGLQGFTVLSDLLPFVHRLDRAQSDRMLRGDRT
jgi:hypothetical protein